MSEININLNDERILKLIQSSIEVGVSRGVEIATRNAVNIIEDRKAKRKKLIYDNRFNNTKLLMKNYRNFKNSVNNAVFKETDLKEEMTVYEVLEQMPEIELATASEVIVESILRSKKRTSIILAHINKILEIYYKKIEKSKDEKLKEKAKIFKIYFIDEENEGITYEEMSTKYHLSCKQLKRYNDCVIRDLATLMFGFDGIESLI